MTEAPLPPVAARGVLLDAWVAKRAEIARLEGEAAELLAAREELFDADVRADPQHRDMIRRSMIAEYSAAGRISKTAAELGFNDAAALSEFFPALRHALRQGAITAQHVRVLIAAAAPVREAVLNGRLDAEALAVYETAALTIAEHETPARTRPHARQIAATLAGESIRDRHAKAASERQITVRPLDDGMALLTAVLPEVYAVAIMDRLRALATEVAAAGRSRRENDLDLIFSDPIAERFAGADPEEFPFPEDLLPDDPRLQTLDRISAADTYALDPDHDLHRPETDAGRTTRVDHDARPEFVAADGRTRREIEADTFIDLLLASAPSEALGTGLDRIAATVQVTIAATTLAGEDDRLAELDGHGPLHPDIARDLARRAGGWSRLFLDDSGMVTKVDRYTPSTAMKRFLRARDQRCRFPGCQTPARRCDIDHNEDYALGGQTEITNLSDFCPGHHALKHPDIGDGHRWTAHQLPDGTLRWTSPIGRTYDDRAPRRVMFA
ncbi:MAG: HNH endonuclease [Microbacterium sp.]|jgi:hypothetical protein|uniref:HNH endonuclease signature motif containing protein n=1 Tax=Microbacterium sp. TaxID=51671 RepID=UPI00283A7596|nr:DUF222 domain-containing protein [Microbacterium sp.]MDR2323285.1 HNH endonuclease [Microbacterium sp.]